MKENNDKVARDFIDTIESKRGDFYDITQSEVVEWLLEFTSTKDTRILELENELKELRNKHHDYKI